MSEESLNPSSNQELPKPVSQPEPEPTQTSSDSVPYTEMREAPELPELLFNVEQEFEDVTIFEDGIKGIKNDEEIIPVLSTTQEIVELLTENNPEADREDTRSSQQWANTVREAFDLTPTGGQFNRTVKRDKTKSLFQQSLKTEKGPMGYAKPSFAQSGAKVSGEKAVIRMRTLMGRGGLITIPLWHSGFWITIRTPSDSVLIELRRRLIEEKITLGRATHGLIFSNVQSFTTGWLLDVVIEHIYETTLKETANIRDEILTLDLPILFWGLACSIWPRGFQYVRAEVSETGIQEKKLIAGKINVSKLMWVDNRFFSDRQRSHMSIRAGSSVTKDAINRYRDDFALFKGREIKVQDDVIKIHLKVPTAQSYIDNGFEWVMELINIVDKTFSGENVDPDARNRAIIDHAAATSLRQYAHWIDSLIIQDESYNEPETIREALNMLSEDDENRRHILTEIRNYIDDVTGAVIAIPEVSEKGTGLPRFPRLIPLDVVTTFFTLLTQRLRLIMSR